jgi:hypothetical protein
MAWLESHQELRNHPKTRRAARALGISLPQLIGHLHCLWWWCLDYAPDGDLAGYSDDDIAAAADWEGAADAFVAALLSCGAGGRAGFLEAGSDGYRIHDWADGGGKTIARRRAATERQRAYRERHERHQDHAPARIARAAPTSAPLTPPSDDHDPSPPGAAVELSRVTDASLTLLQYSTGQDIPSPSGLGPAAAAPAAARRVTASRPRDRPERGWVERHPLFGPVVELFGRPAGPQWALYAANLRALDELQATPEEIQRRAANYGRVMGVDGAGKPILLTLPALVKHWHRCASPEGHHGIRPGSTADDRRRAEERERAEAERYRAALGLNGAGPPGLGPGRLPGLPRQRQPGPVSDL